MASAWLQSSGTWDSFTQWDWTGYWDVPTIKVDRPPEIGFCRVNDPNTNYSNAEVAVIMAKDCNEERQPWLNNSL